MSRIACHACLRLVQQERQGQQGRLLNLSSLWNGAVLHSGGLALIEPATGRTHSLHFAVQGSPLEHIKGELLPQ